MSVVDRARTLERTRAGQSGFGPAACDAAGGWRDKRAQGALGSVGCFCWSFCCVAQCAAKVRKVRFTVTMLTLLGSLHIAETHHGR
ncbi:hypothetical protein IWQ54_002453 [Labrenzia sp. EL_195]|nr:hypothetical protein [Labrenzia sp. EL_195]